MEVTETVEDVTEQSGYLAGLSGEIVDRTTEQSRAVSSLMVHLESEG